MLSLEKIMLRAAHSVAQGKRKAHCSDNARAAVMEAESFEFASEYGEPGYDNPQRGIVFADWNHFPRELGDILERAGYNVEWSDEWIISYETGKAYRSQPDCYGWKPYYVLTEDGDIIGGDEIKNGDQAEWYVNDYLVNNPRRANLFDIDLTAFGFERYNGTFESGFHPGQNDEPNEVFKRIKSERPQTDVVFSINSIGQFDVHFTAWVRNNEQGE